MAHCIAAITLALLFLEPVAVPHHKSSRLSALDVLHPDAAGIDVGSDLHVAAAPSADRAAIETRSFGACTCDLVALADWLGQRGVRTVAMESTGVYWIALYDLLQSKGFTVLLVDPRQIQRAPGRPKTDVLDAQWIRRLHSLGLLQGAFRPEEDFRVLRCYVRLRAGLIRDAARHVQHAQKALEQMNVKLTEAVSDVTGKTGMSIIGAILGGQRDPVKLAALRDPRCKRDAEHLAKALEGTWRDEHLFELRQAIEAYQFCQKQLGDCDGQIEAYLQKLRRLLPDAGEEEVPPPPPPRKRKAAKKRPVNAPRFEARERLYQVTGVDLTAIEGIEEATALVLISEIGTDMSKWPTSKQFCSWLGLCPQVKKSGGKVLSSKVRAGPNRAAVALRLAANSLQRSESALGSFFRRIAARAGRAKAVTATAHKLARLVYALLKHGKEYVAVGMGQYEKAHTERQVRSLTRKAEELGFELKQREATPPKA